MNENDTFIADQTYAFAYLKLMKAFPNIKERLSKQRQHF